MARWRSRLTADFRPALKVVLVALVVLGVAGLAVGVVGDLRGWWDDLGFVANILAGVTGAGFGIPFAVVVLSWAIRDTELARTRREAAEVVQGIDRMLFGNVDVGRQALEVVRERDGHRLGALPQALDRPLRALELADWADRAVVPGAVHACVTAVRPLRELVTQGRDDDAVASGLGAAHGLWTRLLTDLLGRAELPDYDTANGELTATVDAFFAHATGGARGVEPYRYYAPRLVAWLEVHLSVAHASDPAAELRDSRALLGGSLVAAANLQLALRTLGASILAGAAVAPDGLRWRYHDRQRDLFDV